MLGFAREGYGKWSFRARDVREYLRFPGTWQVARHNIRTGARELRNSMFKRSYLRECRKYCPDLTVDDLLPSQAGIGRRRCCATERSCTTSCSPRPRGRCTSATPRRRRPPSAIPIGEMIAAQDRLTAGRHAINWAAWVGQNRRARPSGDRRRR